VVGGRCEREERWERGKGGKGQKQSEDRTDGDGEWKLKEREREGRHIRRHCGVDVGDRLCDPMQRPREKVAASGVKRTLRPIQAYQWLNLRAREHFIKDGNLKRGS
jgi:hypothetical protein